MKRVREKIALTFDDVLLVPRKSRVLPSDVDIRTKLTKNILLNIPLMSAAMDTVTESKLAISMAQQGGIGIIHKNMSIDAQASEVEKVKKYESWIIRHPLTLGPDDTMKTANDMSIKTGVKSFIIINKGKVVGILTSRDMWFEKNMNEKIKNVMTKKPVIIQNADFDNAAKIMRETKIEKLPIVGKDGKLKGLITIKDIQRREKYPNASKDSEGRLLVGAAIGPFDMERAEALIKSGVDVIAVDTAHGHTENVIKTIKQLKKKYKKIDIIAGNVATKKGAEDLIKAGADAVKVGMGPGSICTTRIVAGIGVPQITAISDCVEACEKYNIPIIADGGIKNSGDIAKAIAAGASVVMIGSLFAGTDESPGESVHMGGRKYKRYRGMGSVKAMAKGSSDRYSQKDASKFVPEGVEGVVPYRGTLSEMVFQMVGGLRSSMGYCGCGSINEMRKNTNFLRITKEGMAESHPHDITITEEPPNYWGGR